MQNVEFKAELRDIDLARRVCERLGATRLGPVRQVDTYYRVPDGRLKKREADGEATEFIFYHRPDRVRPRLSHFTIFTEADAKKRFGVAPLPVWLVVRKLRDIWLYKNARVHLDEVEDLGSFIEVEALVSPAHHVGRCHAIVQELRALLGPALGEPISRSYADMMAVELETAPPDAPAGER